MPLLSIGRTPLLLDCNLFPLRFRPSPNRKDFDAARPKRDRFTRGCAGPIIPVCAPVPEKWSGAHQNGLPSGNPIAQQRHVSGRLLFFCSEQDDYASGFAWLAREPQLMCGAKGRASLQRHQEYHSQSSVRQPKVAENEASDCRAATDCRRAGFKLTPLLVN